MAEMAVQVTRSGCGPVKGMGLQAWIWLCPKLSSELSKVEFLDLWPLLTVWKSHAAVQCCWALDPSRNFSPIAVELRKVYTLFEHTPRPDMCSIKPETVDSSWQEHWWRNPRGSLRSDRLMDKYKDCGRVRYVFSFTIYCWYILHVRFSACLLCWCIDKSTCSCPLRNPASSVATEGQYSLASSMLLPL